MLAKHKGNLSKMVPYFGRFRAWRNMNCTPEGWEIFNSFLLHVLVMVVWDDPPSKESTESKSLFSQVMCASPPWPTCCQPWCGASRHLSTTKVWFLTEFGIPKSSNAVADGEIHSLKTNSLPLKMGDPKRNFHLPTIRVQGRAVKLRGVFHWFGTYPLRM